MVILALRDPSRDTAASMPNRTASASVWCPTASVASSRTSPGHGGPIRVAETSCRARSPQRLRHGPAQRPPDDVCLPREKFMVGSATSIPTCSTRRRFEEEFGYWVMSLAPATCVSERSRLPRSFDSRSRARSARTASSFSGRTGVYSAPGRSHSSHAQIMTQRAPSFVNARTIQSDEHRPDLPRFAERAR